MRSPFGGGAFQSGGIADPEADDGGGDDSGGGGGGGSSSGSVTRDRGGAGAGGGGETTAGLGSGDDDSGGGGSSDRRGAPTPEDDDLADTPTNIMVDPGPKGGATVGVTVGGDTDSSGSPGGATPPPSDSGGGSVGPSRQDRDDREATSPNIEGGDQRLFNEAAEQRRDRARSAAQSGGDQRLFTEAAQQQREAGTDEQFGDIPIENPLTGWSSACPLATPHAKNAWRHFGPASCPRARAGRRSSRMFKSARGRLHAGPQSARGAHLVNSGWRLRPASSAGRPRHRARGAPQVPRACLT